MDNIYVIFDESGELFNMFLSREEADKYVAHLAKMDEIPEEEISERWLVEVRHAFGTAEEALSVEKLWKEPV